MKKIGILMKPVALLWLVVVMMLAINAFCPPQSLAQLPARFYWKSLSGGNGVPLIYESLSGNTNPFDPANIVTANADFEATMALVGYARTFPLFNRAAFAAVIVPMGRISGEVTVNGKTSNQSASGFGDPMIEFVINLIGPPAQMNIPDILIYQPGFSVDLLVDLTLPIGEYDSDKQLNIGMNRWYGRIGVPIIWQLGPWVPGQRTTLELLPSLWLYGENDDFVGQTLKTDPKFQMDAHLTRDFTKSFWGSLDGVWIYGGKSSINGVEGEELNMVALGLTLGYQINDNLGLTFSYKSTINDSDPEDLKMDMFMVSLVFGWHPIIEGMKRLEGEK